MEMLSLSLHAQFSGITQASKKDDSTKEVTSASSGAASKAKQAAI
jgi:hypothetical protein